MFNVHTGLGYLVLVHSTVLGILDINSYCRDSLVITSYISPDDVGFSINSYAEDGVEHSVLQQRLTYGWVESPSRSGRFM